jgi:hypothetical protein
MATYYKKFEPKDDKRVKLTQEQKIQIRLEYEKGEGSQRYLAKKWGVSRRLVTFCIDPKKEEANRQAFYQRRKNGRYKNTVYYTKEEWNKIQADIRRRKREANLVVTGKTYQEAKLKTKHETN